MPDVSAVACVQYQLALNSRPVSKTRLAVFSRTPIANLARQSLQRSNPSMVVRAKLAKTYRQGLILCAVIFHTFGRRGDLSRPPLRTSVLVTRHRVHRTPIRTELAEAHSQSPLVCVVTFHTLGP